MIKIEFKIINFQMALDGKAIKEEIPDKEVYESGNGRRNKGESTKRDCFLFFLPLLGIMDVLLFFVCVFVLNYIHSSLLII